jgi:dihydroflavonol-4-reductase
MKNTSLSLTFDVDSAPMGESTQFLITGGTGFIGRHVAYRLLDRGATVRVFCRSPEKALRLFGNRVEVSRGDLCDRASVAAAVRGCRTVIHLGATFQFGRAARRVAQETNVRGTEHLLEASEQNGIERFVYVSSGGVLEGGPGLLTEHDFPSDVPRHQSYRRSKWLGELAALAAAQRGLPVTIASPTCPLGEGDEAPTPTGRMVFDFLRGRFPFSARVGLNFVHVGDMADGVLAVTDRGRIGERYLLGHHNVWLQEFLQALARATDRRAPRLQLPQPVIALAGAIGEAIGSERVCRETAAHSRRRQWYDFSKATQELKWSPRTTLQTIADEAVRWFQVAGRTNVDIVLAESNVAAS